jgi:predicted transposase YdaD
MNKKDSEMYVSVFERVYTEKGRIEGVKAGMNKGIKKGKLEIARKMLARKMPCDTITEITCTAILFFPI